MGFFDRFRKTKKQEERAMGDLSYGSFSITSFFGDGQLVTEQEALKVPTVATSVELITASIAQLPIYLYKENEKGEVEKINDRRTFLLNDEPNELMNGVNFKKQMVKNYLFYGASYAKVEKVRNDVTALYTLPIENITVTKYIQYGYKYSATINLAYDTSNTIKNHEFMPEELLIVLRDSDDGVIGKGILKNNGDTIKLALDEQTYSRNILKNGALPIGILKAASRLTDPVINRLRSSWEGLYGGPSKAGRTIILEEGLDYKPISLNPNDLDLTNSKKNTVSEIARIFTIPESMINGSLTKYTSNEQNNLYFLQYCLAPIITAIEAALNKSLLLESEKEQGYYFRFDTSEIIRPTEKEKVETAAAGLKGGLYSLTEARAKLDMKALDTDYFTWSMGTILFDPKSGKLILPNIGTVLDTKNLEALTSPPQNPQGQQSPQNPQNPNEPNPQGQTQTQTKQNRKPRTKAAAIKKEEVQT